MRPAVVSRRRFRAAISGGGFTLVELLLVSVLGGLVLAGSAFLVVSHIRASATQIRIQQLRTEWRRLTHLIATEVGEGDRIEVGRNTEGNCPVRSALFSVRVPLMIRQGPQQGQLADPPRWIHYYEEVQGGPGLSRCGPPVTADGSLNVTRSHESAPLLTDVNVTVTLTNNQVVTITPTVPGAGGPVQEAVTEFAAATRTGRIN